MLEVRVSPHCVPSSPPVRNARQAWEGKLVRPALASSPLPRLPPAQRSPPINVCTHQEDSVEKGPHPQVQRGLV